MTPAQKVHTLFGWEYDTTNEAGEGDYSSDFVLRKLPLEKHRGSIGFARSEKSRWYFSLVLNDIRGPNLQSNYSGEGDTPRQALQLLAIELREKGVL